MTASNTISSGIFISRITSDDNKTKSYDLSKVTEIEGFVVDSWRLDAEYEGVSIDKNGFLSVDKGVSYTIGVSASNISSGSEILLTTKIFSFSAKIQYYRNLSERDEQFFNNIYASMLNVAGSKK
jgi:hypothetical protein